LSIFRKIEITLIFLIGFGLLENCYLFAEPVTCLSGNCENGFGVSSQASGLKYEGEWKNNRANGVGKASLPGYLSEGEFKEGKLYTGYFVDKTDPENSSYGFYMLGTKFKQYFCKADEIPKNLMERLGEEYKNWQPPDMPQKREQKNIKMVITSKKETETGQRKDVIDKADHKEAAKLKDKKSEKKEKFTKELESLITKKELENPELVEKTKLAPANVEPEKKTETSEKPQGTTTSVVIGIVLVFVGGYFIYLIFYCVPSFKLPSVSSLSEINYLRILVVMGLTGVGVGLFYLHFKQPKIDTSELPLDETYNIKSRDGQSPPNNVVVDIKRPGFYKLTQTGFGSYNPLTYNVLFIGKYFSFCTVMEKVKYSDGNWHHIENQSIFKYPIYIEQADSFTVRFQDRYKSGIDTKINIVEREGGFPKIFFLYLEPDKYNKFKLYIKKGSKFSFNIVIPSFYIDFFDLNGKLISSKKTEKQQLYSGMKTNFNVLFKEDGYLQFKSAEQSFWKLIERTEKEMLLLNDKAQGEATILKKGEIYNSKIWLDSGDDLTVYTGEFQFSVGDDKFESEKNYNVRNSGYLKVKALDEAVINKIKFKRNAGWHIKLKPEETYKTKVKVYPGDALSFESTYRFYINNRLQDLGKMTYNFDNEEELEIKGYNRQAEIYIKVLKRRGL